MVIKERVTSSLSSETGAPRTSKLNSIKYAFSMETIIRQALDQPNLTDAVKNSFIIKLLAGTASLSTPDANILLDFGLELRIKVGEYWGSV